MRRLIAIVLLSIGSGHALAWGDKGHEVIALIAWHYLPPALRSDVESLLRQDRSGLTATDFASEATWADAYRDSDRNDSRLRYDRTRRWHYINLQLAHPDFARACFVSPPLRPGEYASDGPAKACIVDKIDQFTAELRSTHTPRAERLRALQFLIHLVGDLHQPLHAADNGDSGGNLVRVAAKGYKRGTLHGYWDNAVVAQLGRKPAVIARRLVARIRPDQLERWRRGTPRDWAFDSFAVARAKAYAPLPRAAGDGIHELSPGYAAKAKSTAAQQLMKAGVRLAWLLERASWQR